MLIAGKLDGCNLSNFKVSSTHGENSRVMKNDCITGAVESLINRPFEMRRSLFEHSRVHFTSAFISVSGDTAIE